MRKNKLLLLLALLMTAATGAWAQGPWTSGDCTVTLSNGTLTVSGNGAMADYTPGSDRPWYNNVNDITSVVVESGVTTVGKLAFYNFKNMTSVTLPEGLTSIGSDAFYQCVSVTDVNLYADPANLTWDEDGCDDFNRTVMGSTQCHVLAEHLSAYQTKFNDKVNVTFVGDLKPAAPATYTVSMKDGVKDADKWTVKVGEGQAQALPIGGLKGDGSETVTLQYNGRLKVKGVKATSDAGAPAGNIVDLSKLTENTELKDGDVLTGTLAANVKISIADGATVTLDGVTINGVNNIDYKWAGITCLGDATIILTGENTVKGFYQSYPGIYVPVNKTVTIQGIGSLTASSSDISGVSGAGIGSGYQLACGNITIMGGSITAMGSAGAAGIGSGNNGSCGNITITGGTINASANTGAAGIGSGSNGSLCGDITITGGDITATGGSNAAGIGSGNSTSCGNITITGGTINATGTTQAAGIGSGYAANNKTASCGTITITNGVTSVTATKGNSTVPNSIGVGKSGNNNATNTCGTVTIGCTLDTNGNPVGGTTGVISESPYTYQPSN